MRVLSGMRHVSATHKAQLWLHKNMTTTATIGCVNPPAAGPQIPSTIAVPGWTANLDLSPLIGRYLVVGNIVI
jgi:hypothetical protein